MDDATTRPVSTGGPADAEAARAPLTSLLPRCPYRPVDWRWRRARYLLEEAVRPRRRDDHAVRRAREFLVRRRRCHRRGDDRRLAERMPEVHGACAIADGDHRLRAEVEARLL